MADKTAADTAFMVMDMLQKRINQLEEDNERLRQQRDAANAMIDMLMEEMKKAP